MKNDYEKFFYVANILITLLMLVGFILLVVGCSIENNYLIYGSLGGVGIIYLVFSLPLRFFESLIGEQKEWKK